MFIRKKKPRKKKTRIYRTFTARAVRAVFGGFATRQLCRTATLKMDPHEQGLCLL
jgi:hypothetical protein